MTGATVLENNAVHASRTSASTTDSIQYSPLPRVRDKISRRHRYRFSTNDRDMENAEPNRTTRASVRDVSKGHVNRAESTRNMEEHSNVVPNKDLRYTALETRDDLALSDEDVDGDCPRRRADAGIVRSRHEISALRSEEANRRRSTEPKRGSEDERVTRHREISYDNHRGKSASTRRRRREERSERKRSTSSSNSRRRNAPRDPDRPTIVNGDPAKKVRVEKEERRDDGKRRNEPSKSRDEERRSKRRGEPQPTSERRSVRNGGGDDPSSGDDSGGDGDPRRDARRRSRNPGDDKPNRRIPRRDDDSSPSFHDSDGSCRHRRRSKEKKGPNRWMKPDKYDGKGSWETFQYQFDNCCRYNAWDVVDKTAHLRWSLSGTAAQLLWGTEDATYYQLVEKLKNRF